MTKPNPRLDARYVRLWDHDPRLGADPLPADVRARVDALLARCNTCPDEELESVYEELRNELAPYLDDEGGASRCDRCGEIISDIDAGFSPAVHAMKHSGCGGTWRKLRSDEGGAP